MKTYMLIYQQHQTGKIITAYMSGRSVKDVAFHAHSLRTVDNELYELIEIKLDN